MSKIVSDNDIEIPPSVCGEHLVDKRGSVKTKRWYRGTGGAWLWGRCDLRLCSLEVSLRRWQWTWGYPGQISVLTYWVCSDLTKLSDEQNREILGRGKRESGGQGNDLDISHRKNQRLQ